MSKAGKRRHPDGERINNIVVVSDIHCGCQLGLYPPEGIELDEGGTYKPSKFQRQMWAVWREFWDEWVPKHTKDEPFYLVFNGDALDGSHHKGVTQITHNLRDQERIAYACLAPEVAKAEKYFHIRGTEAHVGASHQNEERVAEMLGAVQDEIGRYANHELWLRLGKQSDVLIHFLHHIGSTGSQAYESTAVMKELTESFLEAGRWNNRPPDIIVRSHRHRNIELKIPAEPHGSAVGVVTPAWQGKTPFVWKIPGARGALPQFGGVLIREAPDGEWYVKSFVRSPERTKPRV
jgi:hypothetical protein